MSRCARCDQEVTSGYVLCRRCYERMEGIKEAAIMQEEYQHLVERLRNRSLYKDKATLEIMDLCMGAATVITDLLARTEAAEARAEKAERERDAAVVHGRWKLCYEDDRHQIEGDECTACGFQHYGTTINHYCYCPACGAKMDLEDDEQ